MTTTVSNNELVDYKMKRLPFRKKNIIQIKECNAKTHPFLYVSYRPFSDFVTLCSRFEPV